MATPPSRATPDHSLAFSRVRELASGVDALYLSGHAELSPALLNTLAELKAAAQEQDRPMPLELAGVEFGVEGRSFGRYRYRLVHPNGLVGITESENLPALRVQPRAEFLHGVGPSAAVDFFDSVGEFLAAGPVRWGLSRLDLFCDVQGWTLSGADRHRFVCRAASRVTREEGEDFMGFEFGRRTTGTVCARIYDKTVQVERKGLDWWQKIWGERFDSDQAVLRVEFELGRQGLREFGVDTPAEGLDALGELWASVSSEWLTYRSPTGDETRSRWPVASEWKVLQEASLRADAVGLERVRAGKRDGELRTLLPAFVGYMASVGAILGHESLAATL